MKELSRSHRATEHGKGQQHATKREALAAGSRFVARWCSNPACLHTFTNKPVCDNCHGRTEVVNDLLGRGVR